MTAGVVHYYDQITIFPPHLLPPITAPNRFVSPIGWAARSVFYDDRGYPDQLHDFDVLLHNINGGAILQKRKHLAPPLNEIDPQFFAVYDEAAHGATLCKLLDLSHLDTSVLLDTGFTTKPYHTCDMA